MSGDIGARVRKIKHLNPASVRACHCQLHARVNAITTARVRNGSKSFAPVLVQPKPQVWTSMRHQALTFKGAGKYCPGAPYCSSFPYRENVYAQERSSKALTSAMGPSDNDT
jgi:hypothetical protein